MSAGNVGNIEQRHAIRPHVANEGVHERFLLASLAFAVLGGFTLAVALPLQAALDRMDLGWLVHAQVHGHLQVVGFAGMFVLGVASRLAPRFAGRPIEDRPLEIAFWLLLAGLLGRAIGQPLADHAAFAGVMVAGAVVEAAGALLALVVFARTLRPWAAGASASAGLLTASMWWLSVQACLGAWWLLGLARDQQQLLASDRDAVLLEVQAFGFLLSALIGVGLRSFPTFFGAKPIEARRAWWLGGLLQVGLAMWVVALAAGNEGAARLLATAGQLLVGVAVLTMVVAVGWWKRGNRLAPGSRHIVWSLRALLGWLTVTGVLLAGTAGRALLAGDPVSSGQLDGVRHVFLIGVVTLGITVMGQLILPEFASERLTHAPGRWRGWAFAALLSLAVALRGLVPLAGMAGEQRYWLMAVAGVLGLGAMALFACLYLRARHSHHAYLSRIAGWRAQEIPLA
jgi:uncharacterized protein involved in response to NO